MRVRPKLLQAQAAAANMLRTSHALARNEPSTIEKPIMWSGAKAWHPFAPCSPLVYLMKMHVYRIVQPTTSKLCSRGVEALKTGSSQDAEDHKTQGSQQTECDAHRFRQLYVRFSPGVRDFVQHCGRCLLPLCGHSMSSDPSTTLSISCFVQF